MQYRRYGDKIAARLDRGEEIICSLERLCADEKIGFAWVCAIGAVGSFTVGVFSPKKKTYSSNSFSGDYEIVSLGGNITRKDGGPYIHLHASLASADGSVAGGHLNRAVVSATCEMVLDVACGEVGRRFSDEVGLNLFDF